MKKLFPILLLALLGSQAHATSGEALDWFGKNVPAAQKEQALKLCKIDTTKPLEAKQTLCLAYANGALSAARMDAPTRSSLLAAFKAGDNTALGAFRNAGVAACNAAAGTPDAGSGKICEAGVMGMLESVRAEARDKASAPATAQ